MLVAMVVETMLSDIGCHVIGPFGRLAGALDAAEREQIDAALLDVNLHGEAVFPVADALAKRGIPFVFMTGYGPEGLPKRFSDRPVLTKPYRSAAVLAALRALPDVHPVA